jgi:hypothetical protein
MSGLLGARRATAVEAPADEFVRFWLAGAPAEGQFSCVACGRRVVAVGRLPLCPGCGEALWEAPESSPFAGPGVEFAHALWHEEDLDSAARTVRGLRFALSLGAAIWVLLGLLFYGVTHV